MSDVNVMMWCREEGGEQTRRQRLHQRLITLCWILFVSLGKSLKWFQVKFTKITPFPSAVTWFYACSKVCFSVLQQNLWWSRHETSVEDFKNTFRLKERLETQQDAPVLNYSLIDDDDKTWAAASPQKNFINLGSLEWRNHRGFIKMMDFLLSSVLTAFAGDCFGVFLFNLQWAGVLHRSCDLRRDPAVHKSRRRPQSMCI